MKTSNFDALQGSYCKRNVKLGGDGFVSQFGKWETGDKETYSMLLMDLARVSTVSSTSRICQIYWESSPRSLSGYSALCPWQLALPARATLLSLCLWSMSPCRDRAPWRCPLCCVRHSWLTTPPLSAWDRHGTPGQLRVSSLRDMAGLKGLSCEFLGHFSSCWKVDKLSHNKLSHLGRIRLTDRQHLFYNINYLYWIGPEAWASNK